ncbi:predicted protein [Histoplasma capsulatum H143]|uniref:Uncharacterized protein n=1 Tax=Ajellomyces capsulatus (strain H143) TaxID=544712 RepID=C6HKT8_AJECH|nr:predicted protein [Histoplasma capsulatum H143]
MERHQGLKLSYLRNAYFLGRHYLALSENVYWRAGIEKAEMRSEKLEKTAEASRWPASSWNWGSGAAAVPSLHAWLNQHDNHRACSLCSIQIRQDICRHCMQHLCEITRVGLRSLWHQGHEDGCSREISVMGPRRALVLHQPILHRSAPHRFQPPRFKQDKAERGHDEMEKFFQGVGLVLFETPQVNGIPSLLLCFTDHRPGRFIGFYFLYVRLTLAVLSTTTPQARRRRVIFASLFIGIDLCNWSVINGDAGTKHGSSSSLAYSGVS